MAIGPQQQDYLTPWNDPRVQEAQQQNQQQTAGNPAALPNWVHPPNAADVSPDGRISYDDQGYQLDYYGNRAFGTWPNSNKRSNSTSTAGAPTGLAGWNPQQFGAMGIPQFNLYAWGQNGDWWGKPANQQLAQAEMGYYMPWQNQLFNQYTTGVQRDDALAQWLYNAGWGQQQDIYGMGLSGAQTGANIDQGYATLEQNAMNSLRDYYLGMGTLANDQYRTDAEAYANLNRPYMEAGANMYGADVNAMLGLGEQSQGWAKMGQDYQLGLAELENQQLLESMRQFGRNQAPNVRALRSWY